MELSNMKLVLAVVIATSLLVQQGAARKDQPLPQKLSACVELSVQPGVTDRHPLTSCIDLSTAYFRLLQKNWHPVYVTCVTNKGTAEPSIYENWASKTADCVDQWANIP